MDNHLDSVDPESKPSTPPAKSPNESGVISDVPPAAKSKQEKTACKPDQTPRWKIVLETLAVLVGIAVAGIYYGQLQVMRGQLGEIIRQFPEIQKSANAATNGVTATRDAMKADQRAWVGLASPPQVIVRSLQPKNFQADITILMTNFGKGPALKVMTDERLAMSGHVDDTVQSSCNLIFPFVGLKPAWPTISSDTNAYKHQWGSIIFPNQPLTHTGGYSDSTSDIIGKEAYIVGCIVYQDQFGTPHWTKFCYNAGDFLSQIVKDASSFTRLYACNTNNYTDDIEKK